MGNDRTLAPQQHLTKAAKTGRRHNHHAPWVMDHVVFQNNHATWSGMGGQVYPPSPVATSLGTVSEIWATAYGDVIAQSFSLRNFVVLYF